MSKNLIPLTISAPGFYGLNTQQSGGILPPGWATRLDNFVYDDIGRLSSRKGSIRQHTTGVTGTPRSVHEYIDGAGNSVYIFAASNVIYSFNPSAGTTTDITGTATTPTADNWKFVNFNGWCIGFQDGHAPIELTTVGGSFADITLAGTNQPTTAVNEVLSAFGRLWVIDGTEVLCSDSLIRTQWDTIAVDLNTVWSRGMDEGVALTEWNDFLIIFGKDSILIYENPDDPDNSMALIDTIQGIGCIARDSIQHIGKELLFLTSTGVRTLGRTIQEKSSPIGDISTNVRDALISEAKNETSVNICSAYNRDDGFYLLSLPTTGKSYCFDLKFPNQDGSYKVTEWSIAPTALCVGEDLTMYMSVEDQYISKYSGYLDSVDYMGAGGSGYNVLYEGGWQDFGQEMAQFIKLPKKASILASGVQGTATFKWAVDYADNWDSADLTFPSVVLPRHGIAKHNVNRFVSTNGFNKVGSSMSKSGQVVKIGIQSTVSDIRFALQRIDVLAKIGRLGI